MLLGTRLRSLIVVDSRKQNIDNLLSLDTMIELDLDLNKVLKSKPELVTSVDLKVNAVKSNEKAMEQMKQKYSSLFRDEIGCVPDFVVDLKTRDDVKIVKMPAQRIPDRLLAPTKAKLDKWVEQGIIVPLTQEDKPTFISSINPVEKTNTKASNEQLTADDVRITLNCKNVNRAIIREQTTLLPDQSQIESNLGGAQLFSKVDIKDAFSTIPLSYQTSLLFTFSSPWGHYRLARLVQGVNVSSEIFHNYMVEHFRDIPGVKVCIDDFLVYCKPYPGLSEIDAEKSPE